MKKTLLLITIPILSYAENRFGIGVGVISGKDNLSTSGSRHIQNLGKPEDSFTRVLPFVDLQLSLKRETGVYFLRSIPEGQSPSLQVGLQRENFIAKKAELYLGVNPFRRVWADPYVVSQKREKTYQREYEAGIELRQGLSSLRLSFLYSDVEEDKIGSREPSLRRDRLLTVLTNTYRIPITRQTILNPSLSLENSFAKGKANSYLGYKLGLGGSHRAGDLFLRLNLSAGQEFYRESHPLFGKKEREFEYALSFGLTKRNFFHPSVYATALVGYREANSNINFHDKKTLFGGVLTGYRW